MSNALMVLIFVILMFIFGAGIIVTRIAVRQRQKDEIRNRLSSLIGETRETLHMVLPYVNKADSQQTFQFLTDSPLWKHLKKIHALSGISMGFAELLQIVFMGAAILAFLPLAFELPVAPFAICSLLTIVLTYAVLRIVADKSRTKFLMQLPNAIDLMVSVLRSGHSIPQSIRSVAEESPAPLGSEFMQIFHRLNLGQSLADALRNSVERYESFELDLIRRATVIHQEVGGSLAELLEKTNETLRQRIKLKKQISTMTAQGRLSATICGMLPIIIAVGFSQIDSEYMKPLLENGKGQLMLAAALFLEFIGFIIMHKLSSFRI